MEFKLKTQDELAKLSPEEVDTYTKDLQAHREELQNKAIDTKVNAVKTELEADLKKATDQLKDMDTEMVALKEKFNTNPKEKMTLDKAIENALTENLEALKNLKAASQNGSAKGQEVTLKIGTSFTTADVANASGVTTPDAITYQDVNTYATDPRQRSYIVNYIDRGATDKPALPYIDKIPNVGTMDITAEGALKPLIELEFEQRYSTAVKVAGRIKVSEEALDDIPFLRSAIMGELRYEHDQAEQDEIFVKITSASGAFVAGDLADSTEEPTNYDVIRAAAYAIKIGSNGNFIPDTVFVNPADAYAMGATKDADNNYVLPPFVLPDGTSVAGVRVVEEMNIDAGDFFIGDFRKIKQRIYKPFSIRIGQGINVDGDSNVQSDFESNMFTMIGESRFHVWLYENEKPAFITDTFAAVKTVIDSAV